MTTRDPPKSVQAKFDSYPDAAKEKMHRLRELIFEVAEDHEMLDNLQESLKWGEPSYRTPGGSPIRIDWKEKSPDHYAMYVPCQTSLVETYRELYGHALAFEANRAVVFRLDEELEEDAVKHCIALAQSYHANKKPS